MAKAKSTKPIVKANRPAKKTAEPESTDVHAVVDAPAAVVTPVASVAPAGQTRSRERTNRRYGN